MKKIILIALLFLFINETFSQVSGYMGNKFSIIYSGGFGLPHLSTANQSQLELRLPSNHAINLEYIYNNTSAVSFRYKLGMNSSFNELKYLTMLNYTRKHKFYSHTFSTMVKFYGKNSLAPLGTFSTVGLGFQNLVIKDMIKQNYITKKATIQNYSQYDVIIHYGIGRNWLLFDRVILGFQFETSMPFVSTLGTIGLIGGFQRLEYNGYEKTNINNRFNFSNEILRLSLNLGFLAF